jgi:hypothetical protein
LYQSRRAYRSFIKCTLVIPTDPKALKRDGYKCIASGILDAPSWEEGLVGEKDIKPLASKTSACHIIPFSMAAKDDSAAEVSLNSWKPVMMLTGLLYPKIDRTAVTFETLKRFSGHDFLPELNGDRINRLGNVLTLDIGLRHLFGSQELWFEEIPVSSANILLFKSKHSNTWDSGSCEYVPMQDKCGLQAGAGRL